MTRIKLGRTPTREVDPRNSVLREVIERLQCHELMRMIQNRHGVPPCGARLIVLASYGLEYSVNYCYDPMNQDHVDWAFGVASGFPERWDSIARRALAPYESCL